MATRKTIDYNPESYNNTNDDFMKLLTGEGKPQQDKATKKSPAIKNNLEEETPDEKKLFTMQINASQLKEWKQFCLNNEIPLAMAIRKSMKLLIKGVENGTIEL